MAIIELPKNFLEFAQSLNAHNAKYLIVGGYAVIGHGYPRPTGDLDVFIEVSPENAKKVSAAVTAFGFDSSEYGEEFFLSPDSILMIGRYPWRIDVFTKIKGIDFNEAYKNKIYLEAAGVKIPFVGKADLITSKKASGRHRDLDDINRLTPNPEVLKKKKK